MADHYDTAYMEDCYEAKQGGDGARLAAAGADDNHSATAALMCGAPIFLELSRAGPAGLRRLAGPPDRRGVSGRLPRRPPSLPGAGRAPPRAAAAGRRRAGSVRDAQVRGVYVLDMIAHNSDRDRDVFQIAPGAAPAIDVAGAAGAPGEPDLERERRALESARRAAPGWAAAGAARRASRVPAIAQHLALRGEVRPEYDPRSSLYNTDGQIFSDAGVPVVLFMENYDINRSGYHDTHDTMANIDLDYGAALAAIAIESVARAAAAGLASYAQHPESWTGNQGRRL